MSETGSCAAKLDPRVWQPGNVSGYAELQAVVAQLCVRVTALEARTRALQAANDAWAAETAAANAVRTGGLAPPGACQDSDAGTITHDMPPTAPR